MRRRSCQLWWFDVLENGPSSPYARFFDIDWNPPKADLANKVLLPVLGEQYGRVLENQEIRIAYHDGAFEVRYNHLRLPVAPRTWAHRGIQRLPEGTLSSQTPINRAIAYCAGLIYDVLAKPFD